MCEGGSGPCYAPPPAIWEEEFGGDGDDGDAAVRKTRGPPLPPHPHCTSPCALPHPKGGDLPKKRADTCWRIAEEEVMPEDSSRSDHH